MAREVIGQGQVQGVDYAYTVNGWMKGENSSILNPSYDMGLDGDVALSTSYPNRTVARDAAGFTLNYFNGDYRAIGGSQFNASGLPATSFYNGNITGATYSMNKLNPRTIGYTYKYDQLNRMVGEKAFNGVDTVHNDWVASDSILDFKETVKYDENGNILLYIRHGNTIYGGHLGKESAPVLDSIEELAKEITELKKLYSLTDLIKYLPVLNLDRYFAREPQLVLA